MLIFGQPGQAVLVGPLRDASGNAVTSGASVYVDIAGTPTAGAGTLTHWRGGTWRYLPTAAEVTQDVLSLQLEAAGAAPVVVSAPITPRVYVYRGQFGEIDDATFVLPPDAPDFSGWADLQVVILTGAAAGSRYTLFGVNAVGQRMFVYPNWETAPDTGDWCEIRSRPRVRVQPDGLDWTFINAMGPGYKARTLPQMIEQLWADAYGGKTYDRTAGQIDRLNLEGDVYLRQTATDDGTTQTLGPAEAP